MYLIKLWEEGIFLLLPSLNLMGLSGERCAELRNFVSMDDLKGPPSFLSEKQGL